MGAWWGAVQTMRRRVGPYLEREHGLDFKHFIVLHSLETGARYPGDLHERLQVPPSGVSKLLDELSRRDFITRSLDPLDSRRVVVSLTPRGREVAAGARDAFFALLEEALAGESEENVVVFTRVLERLHHHFPNPAPAQEVSQ